jgi:hypothetical protein
MTPTQVPARIFFGVVFLIMPGLLLYAAFPRLIFGLKTEPAHSLALSAELGQMVPAESAEIAATTFESAPRTDGDDDTLAAEFVMLSAAGKPPDLSKLNQMVAEALRYSPANARAWMLYCDEESRRSWSRAIACLDVQFQISPYDWFTAEQRMQLVAREWPYLDERLRDKAAALVIPMWHTTQWLDGSTLRYSLYNLSRTENGRQLLRAGMTSDRETLRSFNRFVIMEHTYGG